MSWSERLRTELDAKGWTKAELARRSGVPYDSVNKYLRGGIDQPRGDTINKLADALGVDRLWLKEGVTAPAQRSKGGTQIPTGRLLYGGTVAAGLWRLADQYNQDIEEHPYAPATVPRSPIHPNLPQVAWRVVGDSMELARIYDGDWAVGVPYIDYLDKVGELDNGMYVVVEKASAGGSEIELTVKEVQFGRYGMRLIPRSNTKYPEYLIPMDRDADPDVQTVRIVGVVLWAGRVLAPGEHSFP